MENWIQVNDMDVDTSYNEETDENITRVNLPDLAVVQAVDAHKHGPLQLQIVELSKVNEVFEEMVREYNKDISDEDFNIAFENGYCDDNPNVTVSIWYTFYK